MKDNLTEEKFLKDYDPYQFPPFGCTSDVLLLSVASRPQNNYRKLTEKAFSVLLVKRDSFPFINKWCLPGGFVSENETSEEAAIRVLEKETNIKNIYTEQLYTFSAPNRDPRMRVVSTAYMALVDKNRLNDTLSEKASWFDVMFLEDEKAINITLDNGSESFSFCVSKKLEDERTGRCSYHIESNQMLAFDHPLVIVMGILRLKNKVEYTDIVFHMMPEYFTLGELQQVYEVILGRTLLAPAFRRIIAGKVEKTDLLKTGEGHRPSALFRYKLID